MYVAILNIMQARESIRIYQAYQCNRFTRRVHTFAPFYYRIEVFASGLEKSLFLYIN